MANTSNSTTLTTDFNVTPYYDDYEADKNFYRILYKPGYAVQARELTQSQTILQNQIARFGKHVFKEGSIVIPGQFSIERNVDYVKVKDINSANNPINITNFKDRLVVGQTSNISAYIVDVVDGVETSQNTKTIYVRYASSSAANTDVVTFASNEILASNVGTLVVANTSPTGKGSRFSISDGVFFAKEHFISFPFQSLIIDRYSTSPTCKVGFQILEEIVDNNSDTSLLDPALESSNYAAPGADRLKLTPTLQRLDFDDPSGAPDFVELFSIQDGIVTELYQRTQYNIVRDELAKRTFDESGDYYVKGLDVRIRENLDTGINGGFSNTGNSQLLTITVEPGTAYVKGYEVEKLVSTPLTTPKSETFEFVNGEVSSATMGSYVKVNEFTGNLKSDEGTIITLYNQQNKRLTEKRWASGSAVGDAIGTARVKAIEYESGTLGTQSGNVLVYMFDVRMNGTNSFSNVRSIVATNFGGDLVYDTGNTVSLKETTFDTLLYPIGTRFVKSVTDESNNRDMTFNFKRTQNITIGIGGNFTLSPTLATGESFPYGTTGSLSSADRRDIILTIGENANIAGPGTVSGSGTTLTGSNTAFTRFNVGDKIEIAGLSNTFFISTITSDTSLAVSETLPGGISGNSYFKAYKTGDVIDLTTRGFDSGAPSVREVSATPTSISVDVNETFDAQKSGTITYQLAKSSAKEASKLLRPNRFVSINCASAGVSGPFNLGISDIYQIRKIVKKSGSAPSSLTDGTDVTDQFVLDNGQRDTFYDHGRIIPNAPLTSSDRLLISLDHFEPSFTTGSGYFSIDSYPIDDTTSPTPNTAIRTENITVYTSTKTGDNFDLRDCLDFRPVKAATATSATTVGAATTNPATSAGFTFDVAGLRLPVPSTQLTYDYTFYNSRIDLVVMDKEGNISIINGLPGQNPRTPLVSENVMALSSIFIAPYPSLAPNYAKILDRLDLSSLTTKLSNKRFTMREIGVLKNRIVNLEYYASLSLLEKNALELRILDEDGLDRFKNGIFVDTFADHLLGDLSDINYRIVVDNNENSIRPIYEMNSLYYDYLSGTDVTKTGDLVTLPYTDVEFINQPVATSTRNVELSTYRFIGTLLLSPDTDVWVDTEYAADQSLTFGPGEDAVLPETITQWNAWQSQIVGRYIHAGNHTFLGQGGLTTRTIQEIYAEGFKNVKARNRKWQTNLYTWRPGLTGAYGGRADVLISNVIDSERAGTETKFSLEENTQTLGNRVVDVSLIPYIRPQTIKIEAEGLKASTRLHVFFDNEKMNDYVTVLTKQQFDAWPAVVPATTYTEGSDIRSDVDGKAYLLLRVPNEINKRFRVGTKEIIVTDSSTNSQADASTYAKAYFVSQGLIQEKQNTILTTRQVVAQQNAISETKREFNPAYIIDFTCSAYSFLAKAPDGEEGMFMTKVDLFFEQKHPTYGIWVEIREMDAGGGITRNQVPFSEVHLSPSQINISADGSVATTITFPAPVFVYNDTQYAFVIHTVAINPDTYFFIARLGETDIASGNQYSARKLTGTFYTTNNNMNWDMVPDIDLKIKFYRANFDTSVAGEAILGNRPMERLLVANVSSDFITYGEPIKGNTSYGTLSKYKAAPNEKIVEVFNSNGQFQISEQITGSFSNTTANVVSILNQRYSLVDFEPAYLKFNKTSVGFQMQATSNATSTLDNYVNINENNNYYFETEKAVLSRTNEVASLSGDRSNKVKIAMATTTPFLSPVIDLGRTHTIYVNNFINANTYKESYTGAQLQLSGNTANINTADYLIGQTSGANSSVIAISGNTVTITVPSSDFILGERLGIFDANVVTKNVTSVVANTIYNYNTDSGGKLINKYISQPISLADLQDAEDLKILITGYRPPSTDIKIWVRILNAEDGESLFNRPWIELEMKNPEAFSSAANLNDFREYEYSFPASVLTGPDGQVQYQDINSGIPFTGFKHYAVKIGLLGTNSAVVPRVADLRCIALQI